MQYVYVSCNKMLRHDSYGKKCLKNQQFLEFFPLNAPNGSNHSQRTHCQRIAVTDADSKFFNYAFPGGAWYVQAVNSNLVR